MARIYSYLPSELVFNGRTYTRHRWTERETFEMGTLDEVKAMLKREGYYVRVVRTLDRRLRGKENLHGKPYEPNIWIFTSKK